MSSVTELGPNIGLNLIALRHLLPSAKLTGVEISESAVKQLKDNIPDVHAVNASMLDWVAEEKSELVFTKGVLIHIDPNELQGIYQKMYDGSSRYIMIAEYFNPEPVALPYRGHADRLFKRDFAGELLDKFSDLSVRDYGFAWSRDPLFPQGDLNWFLLEKGA